MTSHHGGFKSAQNAQPDTDSRIDTTTAHEYAETIRQYLGLLSDDKEKVEEITAILINRSYDHFKGFFERNPSRLFSPNHKNIDEILEDFFDNVTMSEPGISIDITAYPKAHQAIKDLIAEQVAAARDELEIAMHHELDLLENATFRMPQDIATYIQKRHKDIEDMFEAEIKEAQNV